MTIESVIAYIATWISGWPLIIAAIVAGIIYTIALRAAQFRYFIDSWKFMLFPPAATAQGIITPMQAFINTLSANLGNGSIAGMAVAIASGGPGAGFWVLVIGMLLMSVRLAEVYLSAYFGMHQLSHSGLGGPMLYLRSVSGGHVLAYIYAIFCFLLSFVSANGMQVNSLSLSITQTWGLSPITIAITITLFVAYVVSGGAPRIAHVSEKIVPLKVLIFFGSSIIILAYNYQLLGSALSLIVHSAFHPTAMMGGILGFSVQQAMRFGILRAILATESGLGTAAIMFSATGSKEPAKEAILSMLSTFISSLVCFMIALCIVITGVWDSGLTSTALTIAAYKTVFGVYGGWIVSFLSVSFGIGVLVSFAYIAQESWNFLFGTGANWLFNSVYCAIAFCAVFVNVNALWALIDIVTVGMFVINLIGILYLLPLVQRGIAAFDAVGKR